jgi:hypothetical protein
LCQLGIWHGKQVGYERVVGLGVGWQSIDGGKDGSVGGGKDDGVKAVYPHPSRMAANEPVRRGHIAPAPSP